MRDEPTPERTHEILSERAVRLARPPDPEADAENTLEVVRFTIGPETCAIETALVTEVVPITDLVPLPGTPAFVIGVTPVRGRILPVIDVKRFFDLPEGGLSDRNQLVVLEKAGTAFGVLADAILGLATIDRTRLEAALPSERTSSETGRRSAFLLGITPDRVVVLDGRKLLDDPRLVVDDRPDERTSPHTPGRERP